MKEYNDRELELDITAKEVQSALEHHKQQLEQLGATLEDDVCSVLRKVADYINKDH